MGKKKKQVKEEEEEVVDIDTSGTPTELGLEPMKGLSSERKKHTDKTLMALIKAKADLTMKHTDDSDAVTAEYASNADYTALHYAARRGDAAVCECLLDAKA